MAESASSSTSLKRAPISISFDDDEKGCSPKRGGPPLDGNLFPGVASYAPSSIRGLKDAEMKLWCACGLSKKQPWCDGSHSGTGIKPMKWRVPCKQQRLYLICNCKYTKSPPYCDGTHVNLPMEYMSRVENCEVTKDTRHARVENGKLCTGCGWLPDF